MKPPRPTHIRAASYNIHGCLGRDLRRDPERVVEVIRSLGADVVGLQEVYSIGADLGLIDQLDVLTKATGMEAVFGAAIERDGLSFGNALLTSFPVLGIERHDVSVMERERRMALEVTLELRDLRMRVIVTHLGLRGSERKRQVERLLEIVGDEPSGLVALLGDINEWNPYSRSLRLLGRRFGRKPALATFPAGFPLLALDRIWALPRECSVELEVVDHPLARSASDHLPLLATVSLPETVRDRLERNTAKAPLSVRDGHSTLDLMKDTTPSKTNEDEPRSLAAPELLSPVPCASPQEEPQVEEVEPESGT